MSNAATLASLSANSTAGFCARLVQSDCPCCKFLKPLEEHRRKAADGFWFYIRPTTDVPFKDVIFCDMYVLF